MEQILWTDRKFNFDFPVTLFPVIISRLKGSSPRIRDIVNNLSSHQLIYQPDNKWSIQQHIGHLTDLEELHAGRIIDFTNHTTDLRAWDGVNKKTEEGDHNSKNIETILEDFDSVRNNFIDDLLNFNENDFSFQSIHPRLKVPMRIVDMAYFVAEHDDHHIAKIWAIKNNLFQR